MNNPKILSQVSATFIELTTGWCRCLPLSSLWKEQSLPNMSFVQTEKTRGDRSCPPSCPLYWGPGRSQGRCCLSRDRKGEAGLELVGFKATEMRWGLICEENGICTEFLSAEVFDSAHHHQNISSVAFRKAWLFLQFSLSGSFEYVYLKNLLMSPHLSFYVFP